MVSSREVILVLIVMCLLLGPATGRDLRIDPVSRRVRVCFIGDTNMRTWREMSFDPLLRVSPIPASIGHFATKDIRRAMRLYLPRNYEDYTSRVDLLVLSDTDYGLFTTAQQAWFRDGVIENGLGLVMAGGFEAFGGAGWGTSWTGSPVEDALPTTSLAYQAWSHTFLARPRATAEDHPFVTGLPWNKMPTFSGMNKVTTDPGSIVLLESVSSSPLMPRGEPVLVFGEIGEGSGVSHAPDWNPGWGTAVMNDWEYYGDYVINIAYLAVGVSIPQDIERSHFVRRELAGYAMRRSVALSLIEFADRFGGRIAPLEREIGELEELKELADGFYISQDYDAVLETMAEVTEALTEISRQAVRAKDQALFWVYAIEWMSVTATSLICGFVLWTLMVRRRMYREVAATRLVSVGD
jgi:uncharacterized membrane protein